MLGVNKTKHLTWIDGSPGLWKPLWKNGFQWDAFARSNFSWLGLSCGWMFAQIYINTATHISCMQLTRGIIMNDYKSSRFIALLTSHHTCSSLTTTSFINTLQ